MPRKLTKPANLSMRELYQWYYALIRKGKSRAEAARIVVGSTGQSLKDGMPIARYAK